MTHNEAAGDRYTVRRVEQVHMADQGEFLEVVATDLTERGEFAVYICDDATYPLLQKALRDGSEELEFPHLIKCQIVPPTNGVAYEVPHASLWHVYIPFLPEGASVVIQVREPGAYDDAEQTTDEEAVPSLENHPIAHLLYPPSRAAVEYYRARGEDPGAADFRFTVTTPNDFVMGDVAGMVARSTDMPGAYVTELHYREIDGTTASGYFLIEF